MRSWSLIALGAGPLLVGLGLFLSGMPVDLWFAIFVLAAGFVTGALGLLLIGHLMSEEWLRPVRSEAEAIVLCAPLLFVLALPLTLRLDDIYPWALEGGAGLPSGRATLLSPAFFLARGAAYLAVWTALGVWVTRTRDPRRVGAIGLALLAPTATLAANDWVLSREPLWWSSLFGFSFALSQLLAALALGILISLLRPEHPSPGRMQSLERALLSIALLVLWAWFAQFLIVWLANLPNEGAWYLNRARSPWLGVMVGLAIPALVLSVLILAPPGFGRRTMIAGSTLILVHHVAHMAWLIRPEGQAASAGGLLVALGLAVALAACFAAALRTRPHDERDAEGKVPTP